MPPALLSLPDEVLKCILNNVSLKDRPGSCCLVHTRLHAAAVAATQHVQIGHQYRTVLRERSQSLLDWCSLYGQHVTRLEVWQSQLWPLTQLSYCTSLLDLRLHGHSSQQDPTADGGPSVVGALTKLTRLELRHNTTINTGATVDSLSGLVHLKHLHASAELSAATLPRLSGLTFLGGHSMSLENLRQLSALTALQELDCSAGRRIAVSPSSVTGVALPPSLTKLTLTTNSQTGVEAALLRLAPTGLRVLQVNWFEYGEPLGSEWLLSGLSRLQCLAQLVLQAWPDDALQTWPPPGPVYSALTASSSLVCLELAGDFPAGVWPFVFRATHQLPHLTRLVFDAEWSEPDARDAFGAADLAALINCCPHMCEVCHLNMRPGPHVSELHKLTALTSLYTYCGGSNPRVVIQGMAAVTQHSLLLDLGTVTLSTASLLPLTSLTALTYLHCSWCDVDTQDANLHTKAGSPPDVWLRLLECCAAADAGCQPAALRGLAQQLAEQQALTAAQQQQLSAQAQEIAGLRARAATAEAQLSAQQQVAAEQGARIAGLEGQLQQLLQRLA